jgi:lipopolysaccharide transport system permease protein
MVDVDPRDITLDPVPSRVIQPTHGWRSLRLRELWEYRELLFFLTWRDILIRYKQAVLGAAWALLQPFLTMVVFTVIFGALVGVKSGPVPYALFTIAGLLPWNLFAGALQRSGTSLVSNSNLLTKVYFPRLVMPISGVITGLVDFLIGMCVLAAVMVYYGVTPTWYALLLPLFVILALITSLAVSLWLAALNVLYRDVQYIIPFIIQLGLFISPVIYSPTSVPAGPWRIIYGLNPMAGVLQGFRWALFGGAPPGGLLAIAVAVTTLILIGGFYYFRRMERMFADVV